MRTLFAFLILQSLASALIAWRAFATGHIVTGAAMATIALVCVLLLALFVSAPGREARRAGVLSAKPADSRRFFPHLKGHSK